MNILIWKEENPQHSKVEEKPSQANPTPTLNYQFNSTQLFLLLFTLTPGSLLSSSSLLFYYYCSNFLLRNPEEKGKTLPSESDPDSLGSLRIPILSTFTEL